MRWLRKLLNSIGFDIVRLIPLRERNLAIDEKLGYELEEEATDCIQVVQNHTMLSKRRLVTLFQQAAYCERFEIPGAFVECGVWKGGAAGMMALASKRMGQGRRHLHMFDAYQEICEPDARFDGEKALTEVRELTGRSGQDKGDLRPLTGIYDSLGGPGTLEENRELLENRIGYPPDLLHYHVGWFQDTIPAVHEKIGPIAILRLDGDWYASTRICLEFLFDKVVSGGIIIIDDYGTYEGCRLALDEYMAEQNIRAYLCSVDSDCRYIVKTW